MYNFFFVFLQSEQTEGYGKQKTVDTNIKR